MQEFIQIISTIGFPSACCLFLIHKYDSTVNKLADIVASNTEATNKAVTQLGQLITQFNTFLADILHKGE